MLHTFKIYLLCLPFTLLLDYIWLAKLMQGFYVRELGTHARVLCTTIVPVYWSAAIVYLLLPLGIVLFALPRVDPSHMVASSLGWGGKSRIAGSGWSRSVRTRTEASPS